MTARIGLIIPSSNRMVEQEMARHFPAGVTLHVARLRMTGPHHVALDQLLPRIEEATRTLTDAKCDVVAFHCTATSMEEGMAGEERVLAAVARAGAPRATTTATAIRRAFDALGARRIVLVTPYSAQTTAEEAEFLHAAGCEVLHAVGHALAGSDAYCATPPAFWRDSTLRAARREADAYLVSCANIAAMGVIDELEQRLDRPVITSNQAVLWDALVRIGHEDVSGCPGRLFATGVGRVSRRRNPPFAEVGT
jgi:maleate isomerase